MSRFVYLTKVMLCGVLGGAMLVAGCTNPTSSTSSSTHAQTPSPTPSPSVDPITKNPSNRFADPTLGPLPEYELITPVLTADRKDSPEFREALERFNTYWPTELEFVKNGGFTELPEAAKDLFNPEMQKALLNAGKAMLAKERTANMPPHPVIRIAPAINKSNTAEVTIDICKDFRNVSYQKNNSKTKEYGTLIMQTLSFQRINNKLIAYDGQSNSKVKECPF